MKHFYLLFFLVQSCIAFSQIPPPCPSITASSDICNQACVSCALNGFQNTTAGYTSQTPTGFCGSIENEQWIGFIAGESSVNFTAVPSNCTNGDGIQMALYSSCSGSPLGCFGGMGGGGSTPATLNITGMVAGQSYVLMIDGFAGDQCDFNLSVNPQSAVVPPIPATPSSPNDLDGPRKVCPSAVVEYCVPYITGAGGYRWNAPADAVINGMPPPATITSNNGGECVTVTFGSQSGTISVQGINACHEGDSISIPVIVNPIPDSLLSDTVICQRDLPYITPWGAPVNSTGFYSNNFITDIGCDSLVRQFVFVKISIPTVLPPNYICTGDSVSICDTTLSAQGNYSIPCTSYEGCDSSINVTLINFSDVPSQITPTGLSGPQAVCLGGSVEFCVDSLTTGYTWSSPNDILINGITPSVGTSSNQNCISATFLELPAQLCVNSLCSTTPPLCQNVIEEDTSFFLTLPDTSLCIEDFPYQAPWGAQIYNSGNFLVNISSTMGCDSIFQQNVHRIHVASTQIPPITYCNTTPILLCGDTLNTPGNYTTTCTSYLGCDSLVRIEILPVDPINLPNAIICPGDFLIICNDTIRTAGQFSIACPDANGCDSLLRIQVSINQDTFTKLPDVSVCENELPYITPWGANVDSSGTYHNTFVNHLGCDSLVELKIEITQNIAIQLPDTTLCEQDLPFISSWGETIQVAGFYEYVYSDPTICDSIVSISVEVNPSQLFSFPDTSICESQLPYISPWGEAINSTGIYGITYPSANQCDSVIQQSVTVLLPDLPTIVTANLCPGDSLNYCGNTVSEIGNYQFNCINQFGCDSTVILSVFPPNNIAQILGAADLTPSNPTVLLSYQNSPGTPVWYMDGVIISTDSTYLVSEGGTYVLELEFPLNSGNCSVFDTVFIQGIVSTGNLKSENSIFILPTIGSGNFIIHSEKSPMQHVRIIDMRGRLLFEEKTKDIQNYTLDASTYPSGTYHVLILVQGKWEVQRIIKM